MQSYYSQLSQVSVLWSFLLSADLLSPLDCIGWAVLTFLTKMNLSCLSGLRIIQSTTKPSIWHPCRVMRAFIGKMTIPESLGLTNQTSKEHCQIALAHQNIYSINSPSSRFSDAPLHLSSLISNILDNGYEIKFWILTMAMGFSMTSTSLQHETASHFGCFCHP